jgi:lysophospholipase L1-like esterase
MRRSRTGGVLSRLIVALLFGLVGTATGLAVGVPTAAAATPDEAIVALGDSTAAGEGGGDYLAGTRGEGGDWCHRSPHAAVTRTGLGMTPVNLACSGAASADVGFGTAVHDTEGSQAQRLVTVARMHRVGVVVVQLGANDDPGFGSSMVRCVITYLTPTGPGCSGPLAAEWPSRLSAMQPKVTQALRDVRSAMGLAGYRDADYELVVMSYASPVTEAMIRTHGFAGCPFRDADARWGRTTAVPQLSEALHEVARTVGARFLDMSRAAEGHEACTSAGVQWQRRLTVNAKAFAQGGLSAVGHLAQESFHPNVSGYAQFGGCLGEFLRAATGDGACRVGADGRLHAVDTTEPAAPVR